MSALLLILLASVHLHVVAAANVKHARNTDTSAEVKGTVYLVNGSMVFKSGVIDPAGGVAYGQFVDTLATNGWGVLDIVSGEFYNPQTGSPYLDADIMAAGGFLEGCLTSSHIYNQFQNVLSVFIKPSTSTSVTEKLKVYFEMQQTWMLSQVQQNPKDKFWQAVGLIMNQYLGLYNGYNSVAPYDKKLDLYAFQILNYAGDLLDLMHVIDKEHRPDFSKMTKEQLKAYRLSNSHCSALIKLLPGYEDVLFSHSSWFAYQATDRIYKYYSFSVDMFASSRISFASYPGFLESLDDFYLMHNGLVMLQTTNGIYNMSLYDLVSFSSVPAWVRVRVANHMARNASDWGYYLSQFNSGTYNNQYMVLDLNKIKLQESVEDHALYIVEQIPGLVENTDQTDILRLGHWASYNVPFHESIYNLSGYPEQVRSQGTDMTYELAPRAKIFRRDAGKVTDMDSMKRVMRYNGYKTDKYSKKDPCDTICCRGDLMSPKPAPMGCYDTKVSNYTMGLAGSAWVLNGPTTTDDGTGQNLKPFSWSQFANVSHVGLPPVYNFPFIKVQPTL